MYTVNLCVNILLLTLIYYDEFTKYVLTYKIGKY